MLAGGECVYLPLPYKENQFVTCFHWILIRAEMSEWKPAVAHFPALTPNTLHSTPQHFTCDFRLVYVLGVKRRNKADYLKTLILTAQKTGFMPALPLALHFLGEVDGFLAAAALVSPSERHSVSTRESPLCTFLIHCIYNVSALDRCYSADKRHLQHLRLDATIPIKGEAPVGCDSLLGVSSSLTVHSWL